MRWEKAEEILLSRGYTLDVRGTYWRVYTHPASPVWYEIGGIPAQMHIGTSPFDPGKSRSTGGQDFEYLLSLYPQVYEHPSYSEFTEMFL